MAHCALAWPDDLCTRNNINAEPSLEKRVADVSERALRGQQVVGVVFLLLSPVVESVGVVRENQETVRRKTANSIGADTGLPAQRQGDPLTSPASQ